MNRETRRGGGAVIDMTPFSRNRPLQHDVDVVGIGEDERGPYQVIQEVVGKFRLYPDHHCVPHLPEIPGGMSLLPPMLQRGARRLLEPFLTMEDRLKLYGVPGIAGAARESDYAALPVLSPAQPSVLTATTNFFFLCPRPFLLKGVAIGCSAAADFTTADESIALGVDQAADGTTFTAVITPALMGGAIFGSQFTVTRTRVFPVTAAASLITAEFSSEINVRIAGSVTVRVVATLAGTTPIFSNAAIVPFGIFL